MSRAALTIGATWYQLPAGRYAVPIVVDKVLLGYAQYERVAPKETKRGKVGKHRFRVGQLVARPGHEQRRELLRTTAAELLADIQTLLTDPDRYRQLWGTYSGKCGWCGRRLTDPESRLLGVGPDCRQGMNLTAPEVAR